MDDDLWIVIPNWKRFQHYQNRDPIFIKDYVSQLNDADWIELTLAERGALQMARLMYAASDGRLTLRHLKEALKGSSKYAERHIEALNHAGLLGIVASRPLALTRSREKRREEKKEGKRNQNRGQAQPWDTARVSAFESYVIVVIVIITVIIVILLLLSEYYDY